MSDEWSWVAASETETLVSHFFVYHKKRELIHPLIIFKKGSSYLESPNMTPLTAVTNAYLEPLLRKHNAGQPLLWEDLEASRAASTAIVQGSDNKITLVRCSFLKDGKSNKREDHCVVVGRVSPIVVRLRNLVSLSPEIGQV